MSVGQWHGGKGSAQRPESKAGNYREGFDGIDWNAREREAAAERLRQEGKDFTAHAVESGFIDPAAIP